MQKCAQGVDVSLHVVLLAHEDLGGVVAVGADLEVGLVSLIDKLMGAAKVSELEGGFIGEVGGEDVLHFDVAVDDVSSVELFESSSDLLKSILCVLLSQRLVWLLADILEEVSSFNILGDNDEVVFVLEGLEGAQEVVAVKLG